MFGGACTSPGKPNLTWSRTELPPEPRPRPPVPKPVPVPDEVSKPFWDACNERRLTVQNCAACSRMQYPPQAACAACGSAAQLEWRQVSGRGRINGYCVM